MRGDLRKVAVALRDYIDAIPAEQAEQFPVMPGVDRDWVDEIIAAEPEVKELRQGFYEVTVNWDDTPCPVCGSHRVEIETANECNDMYDLGDQVNCSSCGHQGEINIEDGSAYIEWSETDA